MEVPRNTAVQSAVSSVGAMLVCRGVGVAVRQDVWSSLPSALRMVVEQDSKSGETVTACACGGAERGGKGRGGEGRGGEGRGGEGKGRGREGGEGKGGEGKGKGGDEREGREEKGRGVIQEKKGGRVKEIKRRISQDTLYCSLKVACSQASTLSPASLLTL